MLLQVLKNWACLQRSQWTKRKLLLEAQSRKLQHIVDHAYSRVPFYQNLYQGLVPPSVTDIEGLRKLPQVNKDQLRVAPLDYRTAAGTSHSTCRLHTTSGSTGMPLQVLEDAVSLSYRDAKNLRLLWNYGVRPLDRIVWLRISDTAGGAQPTSGDAGGLWAHFRNKLTMHLTYGADLNEHLRLFSVWKPDVLIAATPYCKGLARLCERTGKNLNFRIMVTSGVTLDDWSRKYISNTFGADVYDHYGMEEAGGSIAWECPTRSGYHINAETVLLEFLSNGQPVGAGEPGEIHLTSFYGNATPILRYSTGDIAVPIEDECACGRGLPLIRRIQGRAIDFIATEQGRYISPGTVITAIGNVAGVGQFKVLQREDYSIQIQLVIQQRETDSVIREVERRCSLLFREEPVSVSVVNSIENLGDRKFRVVESRLPR